MMRTLKLMFAWDSLALFIICVADMLSTLYWVSIGAASEANPLMNYWLKVSPFAFCLAKMMSVIPLLIVAAYYRIRRPRLVRVSLRGAIILYLAVYGGAVAWQVLYRA